jgi:DNA (cytosine-5)-methyltransferase 1
MPTDRPVAIDLFSGAGGLGEGMLAAGIDVKAAIEKHPHPALTCAFNHASTTVICDDIAKLEAKQLQGLLEHYGETKKVDVVVGGPPCQGFSPAGAMNPRDARNGLYKHYLRMVRHFQPRICVLENVPGLITSAGGRTLEALTKGFRSLGYQLKAGLDGYGLPTPTYSILDASDFGVPQHRKRLFIVAYRRDELERDFEWPKAKFGTDSNNGLEYVSVQDALSDLDFLCGGYEAHSYPKSPVTDYQHDRRKNSPTLFNHLATKHRLETVQRYRRIRPGATIRSIPIEYRSGKQTMSRLQPTCCSKVVLALPDDFIHYRRHRIPTVREMARLQSFDDDFVFLGKRTTSDKGRRVDVPQYTQVGNAVPPLLAKALGIEVLKSLGFRPADIRCLAARRKRHQWLCGSSGFAGYTLLASSISKLNLVNADGDPIDVPLGGTESLMTGSTGQRRWSSAEIA